MRLDKLQITVGNDALIQKGLRRKSMPPLVSCGVGNDALIQKGLRRHVEDANETDGEVGNDALIQKGLRRSVRRSC